MKHEITAGIFFVTKEFKLLLGHPTGSGPDVWSIPKGKLDEGESEFGAAIRETIEETNVDLSGIKNYHILGHRKYKNKRKTLSAFLVFESENDVDSSTFDLKCESLVDADARFNAGKPEIDDFKYVSLDEAKHLVHHTQAECIVEIVKLIKG